MLMHGMLLNDFNVEVWCVMSRVQLELMGTSFVEIINSHGVTS
jgi:hypothetical protein